MNTKIYKFKNTNYKKNVFKRILFLILLFVFFLNIFHPIILQANTSLPFAKNNHSRASMDEDGNIYIRENLYNRIYPASLTKIAISIIAIEKLKLSDEVFIQEIDYNLPLDYVTTPLYLGETLTVEDLLYATMLKSGNDAAIYLAKEVYGNKENFIEGINKYLKDLGLINTNFTNPFGLEEDNHYTTPYDLLLLTKHAMENRTFKEIVSKTKYVIPENNFSEERVMRTTSLFAEKKSSVFNPDFYGIKSGYTESAGDCYISANKILDKEFYFIYTGADSRISKFINIQKMYDETKYILEQKNILDNYAKTNITTNFSNNLNLSYFKSRYLFSTLDKIFFSTFAIFIFFLISKVSLKKRKKKKTKRKKRRK